MTPGPHNQTVFNVGSRRYSVDNYWLSFSYENRNTWYRHKMGRAEVIFFKIWTIKLKMLLWPLYELSPYSDPSKGLSRRCNWTDVSSNPGHAGEKSKSNPRPCDPRSTILASFFQHSRRPGIVPE